MKIVAYIRTSTEQQKLGLEAQRKKIAGYAELYDHEIVEWCEDAGVSGKSLDRPGLKRALALVESGKAERLCVTAVDRLTRSPSDLELLLNRAPGMSIVCLDSNLDPTTASGRMVLNLLFYFDEWQRVDKNGYDLAVQLARKLTPGPSTASAAPVR